MHRLLLIALFMLLLFALPACVQADTVVTTLAGTAGASGSADGTGSAAKFKTPSGVAVDSNWNVYVADTYSHTIRKVTPGGVVTTLAGSAGAFGSADGTGSAARFYQPYGVAVDSNGNVYVADQRNHTIRKVTSGGVVSTLAGSAGVKGSADGTGSAAQFNTPHGLAVDSNGNIYVADTLNYTIRKVTPGGVVTTLAGSAGAFGSADGTGSAARFSGPTGVAVDSNRNLFVADYTNGTIRKVTPGGVVTTLAGSAGAFGTAAQFKFKTPSGVAVDSNGNVYVADTDNQTIRKVTPGGVVSTLAGSAGVKGSADGTGSAAQFFGPTGVAVDSNGNVYVADQHKYTIRKVTPGGVATPLAGTAGVNGGRLTPSINASLAAQDIKTKDGKLYKKATITAATDAYVTVSHDDGLARIFLENLPDELQKNYGYDPQKADQHLATEAQAQAEAARQRHLANFDKASVFVSGSISQVLNGSIMFRGSAGTAVMGLKDIPDLIVIVGSFDGSVDGDPWKGRIWPAGTHSYNSVGAGVRTIQRWATTREAAIALQTK